MSIARDVKMLVILIAVLAVSGVTSAQAADPISVIRAFQHAVNAEDVDAATALFAHDALVSNTLGRQFTGSDRIRNLIQANVDAGLHLVPEHLRAQGNRVTWSVTESNSIYKKLGLSLVEMTTAVVVQAGRIKFWTTYFPLDVLASIERGCADPRVADVRLFDLPCADFVAQARSHTEAVLRAP